MGPSPRTTVESTMHSNSSRHPCAKPDRSHSGRSHLKSWRLTALSVALIACGVSPAFAQSPTSADQAEIRQQIEALRADQARIAELQQRTDASIRALESKLHMSSPAAPAATPTPAAAVASDVASRLKISGDMRVRGQQDYPDNGKPNRHSDQVRGRIGATYAVSDLFTVGARLVTGNPDDPRSTDAQLSGFDKDLTVSLDQAYIQLNLDKLKVNAGKIPQPFTRTELVWDGDVSPQGISANYKTPFANGGAFRANGMVFVIDRQGTGSDSTMLGGQLGYDSPALGNWKYDFSAAYYKYTIGDMRGANPTYWRTNLLRPDGRYLSDFHLVDTIVGISYSGLSEKWPLRFVGDYVKNTGARTSADTGYGADLLLGRISSPGDWRFGYGYAMAQADAVMSAFSHDNTSIATNYRLHTLSMDYVPSKNTVISAVWYHYKPYNAIYAGSNNPSDWLNRVRLAFLVNF